ncbi:unnamed protein product [Rhizophagus irregularis]|nr:unnamed protein product [Rhizophagus irregularis]
MKTDLYPKALLKELFPKSLITQYYGRVNLVLSNGDDWNVIVVLQFAIKPSFRNLPEHVFIESKLLNVMEKVDNKPIEIENLIHRMALDVLGRADFGFDFNV